jgi:hypothetical protein
MSWSVVPLVVSPSYEGGRLLACLQWMFFELRGELHAPWRVDRLRLRGFPHQLGVRKRGHQARNGDQRRDEPPFARHYAQEGVVWESCLGGMYRLANRPVRQLLQSRSTACTSRP